MSYSYGPTVIYPPASLTMGDAFASSFEHKENYGLGVHAASAKTSTQGSRQAFGNLENLSSAGCYAALSKDGFQVLNDSCCAPQVASTSSRAPLSEKQAVSQASQRQPSVAPPVKKQAWVDIDAQNRDNPLACSEYAESIFEHLNTCELLNRPNPKYLETVQYDMSPHMRCILVDWLVEVGQEYRLTSDTLHLTLNLLDRFLSLEAVPREELQLAGIACMWAASKFEEIYAPTARNFCYITDNTYDQQQLVDMEARLLSALSFRLAVPTAKTFQRRYLQAAAADEQLHYLAAFLLELTLMDDELLVYLPSQLAAASVYLANSMLGRKPWDATLAHYSRYREFELQPCACDLAYTHAQIMTEGQFMAIKEKYASDKLLRVANIPGCPKLVQHSSRAAMAQAAHLLQVAPDSPEASSDMELL